MRAALAAAIEALLAARPGGSISPADAAQAVRPEDWRPLLALTRRVAAELARQGRLVITRKGRAIDPGEMRGVIRLRLPPS
ncbi:MAG: hypothetical protein OHK0024_07290 [Thalassobaculales bacterium]